MTTKNTSPIAKPKPGKVPHHPQQTATAMDEAFIGFEALTVRNRMNTLVAEVTGVWSGDRNEMIKKVRSGLLAKDLIAVQRALQAPQREVAKILSIPISTLTRRKKAGRLNRDESERVVRIAHLVDSANSLIGDEAATRTWLRTPMDLLGGNTPLEHAETEMGARDVEDLIGRLCHGVFS